VSFQGTSFIFDGIPSETYGLVLANFDSGKQGAANYGGSMKVHEDRIAARATGLDYGATMNEALSFPLSFVTCHDGHSFDRYDQAAIAGWLTGHKDFKTLAMCQEAMEGIFYKWRITQLEALEAGMRQVGFTGTVVCDGPYAYRTAPDTVAENTTSLLFRNLSNVNDYYRPIIELRCTGNSLSIVNEVDGSQFTLSGMPNRDKLITIDCQNQTMMSDDGTSLYPLWNLDIVKRFPRFLRGDNPLTLSGIDSIRIHNVFPWNIGH